LKSTRESLLSAATVLFSGKGYGDTSIREIGTKAGVSDSIIYHYFKNKEDLLFQIIQIASQDLIQMLVKIDEEISDPVECLYEMLLTNMTLFNLKRNKEIKIITSDRHWLRGKRHGTIKDMLRKIRSIYVQKLYKMSEMGLLNDIDLSVLSSCISNNVVGFHEWYHKGGHLSAEEAAHNVIKFVFNASLNKKGLDLVSRLSNYPNQYASGG